MGMPTIQYGNLEEHDLKFDRYRKDDDVKKKKTLALKALNSFDEEVDEVDTKDEEDEVTLLSKKLQRILKDKRNKEKRKALP